MSESQKLLVLGSGMIALGTIEVLLANSGGAALFALITETLGFLAYCFGIYKHHRGE